MSSHSTILGSLQEPIRMKRTNSSIYESTNYYSRPWAYSNKKQKRSNSVPPVRKPEIPDRDKTDYSQNVSIALELPVTSKELNEKKNDVPKLISLSSDLIREHAARRVDLFFYTLIAYYKTGLAPIKGRTKLQHGRGRNADDGVNITQGCHSSFFGEFIDNVYRPDQNQFETTQFLNNLNATMELPFSVNKFDDVLEEMYFGRQKSLNIIYQVSRGTINPVEGLKLFLQMLAQIFRDIENHTPPKPGKISYLDKKSSSTSTETKLQIFNLEKSGTFTNKWNAETNSVNDAYIAMLLRLTPEEISLCNSSDSKRNEIYIGKFDAIKQEILNSAGIPFTPISFSPDDKTVVASETTVFSP